MPFLQLGIEGGVGISREELIKIKQAMYEFMRTFKHLDLMLGNGQDFVRHALTQAALKNGADWAKCNIKKTLSGEHRAFVEYGKIGGRWQLFSVVIPRHK
jgi:hypothetical protein